jgi:hypothetical protein
MCLLAFYFRAIDDVPLVVGANREEMFARGGTPPQLIEDSPRAVAGIDPLAGGTWLGVNQHGLVIAVTNRPKSRLPAAPKSRGLLALELLSCVDAKSAADLAASELGRDRYAGCNVVCADQENAVVLHAGDWLRVRPLPPGLHVLSSHDVDDIRDPRIGHALRWLKDLDPLNGDASVQAFKELCGQTGNGGPPICLRGELGGTVSSSIIMLCSSMSQSVYLHAQGPPDHTCFEDYSHLLRRMDEVSSSRA